MVNTSDQPAESYPIHDVLDAVVSLIRGRDIIDRQENSSHPLDYKQKQAGAAQCLVRIGEVLVVVEIQVEEDAAPGHRRRG